MSLLPSYVSVAASQLKLVYEIHEASQAAQCPAVHNHSARGETHCMAEIISKIGMKKKLRTLLCGASWQDFYLFRISATYHSETLPLCWRSHKDKTVQLTHSDRTLTALTALRPSQLLVFVSL